MRASSIIVINFLISLIVGPVKSSTGIRVHFKSGNAFAITPDSSDSFDWIFSDVACYPEKLLEWVQLWLNSGKCKNFICTLKFQGDDDYQAAQAFAKIPGSHVMHLSHNKHELTWICIQS